MILVHDQSHRAKKERLLVLGKRYYDLEPQDRWIDCFIPGIGNCGRSYDIQVEATGTNLRRN